jgi:hypothetical protein
MLNSLSNFWTFSSDLQYFFWGMFALGLLFMFIFLKTGIRTLNGYRTEFGNRLLSFLLFLLIAGAFIVPGYYLIKMYVPATDLNLRLEIVGVVGIVLFVVESIVIGKCHRLSFGKGIGALFMALVFTAIFLFVILLAVEFFTTWDPLGSLLTLVQ